MLNQSHIEGESKYIELPKSCTCLYFQQISAYRCSFLIKNVHTQTLYLNVNSTFDKFMQIETSIQQLKAGQSRQFTAKLRPPNQIYRDQFIAFTYSLHPYAQYCSILDLNNQNIIKLQFATGILQDEQIDNILKQQSKQTQSQAIKQLRKGNCQAAISTSEEAFILYRKNISCLMTIAEAYIKSGQIWKASKKIQILFYFPDNPQYYKAVIIKAQVILTIINTIDTVHRLKLVRRAMKLLKKINQNEIVDQQNEKRCAQVMAKYQKIKQQLLSTERNILFKQLIEKAKNNFDNFHNQKISSILKQPFKDKEQFISFMTKLTKQQHKMHEQTPQYALDPVNYEIFKDPVILPSGVSLQKDFMVKFIQKHGPSDPFTRAYLDPTFVFSNITLKLLVRNSPNLAKWLKYQEQTSRF